MSRYDSVREYVAGQMPDTIKRLISLATLDLNEGPVFLDAEGERCGPFDDGAKRFDFSTACREIGAFFEDIGCLYVDEDGGLHTAEPEATVEVEENPDHDPDDPDSEPEIEVRYGPTPYWEIPRTQIVGLVAGSLAQHL